MDAILKLARQAVSTIFIPVHPAGWPFILGFTVFAVILAMLDETLGMIGLILAAWCYYFFRNPVRITPQRDGLIVSPADGIVSMITKVPLPPELQQDDSDDPLYTAKNLTRISVFLNVFDVHIQRAPIEGEVTNVVYHAGKFLNAALDKASLDNERNSVVMKSKAHKSSIAFVQIAGLVARRILCDVKKGDSLSAGEIYGLIRFGSRVDIYLPPRVNPMVIEGQRMVGGETIIADLKSKEKAREGLNANEKASA